MKLLTGKLLGIFVSYSIIQLTKLTSWPCDSLIQPTGSRTYHLGVKAQLHQLSYEVKLHSHLFSRLNHYNHRDRSRLCHILHTFLRSLDLQFVLKPCENTLTSFKKI